MLNEQEQKRLEKETFPCRFGFDSAFTDFPFFPIVCPIWAEAILVTAAAFWKLANQETVCGPDFGARIQAYLGQSSRDTWNLIVPVRSLSLKIYKKTPRCLKWWSTQDPIPSSNPRSSSSVFFFRDRCDFSFAPLPICFHPKNGHCYPAANGLIWRFVTLRTAEAFWAQLWDFPFIPTLTFLFFCHWHVWVGHDMHYLAFGASRRSWNFCV